MWTKGAETLMPRAEFIVFVDLEQPENQPHRADLSKMLVHRRARRRGLGAALMRAAEAVAVDCGKSLLVLDTDPLMTLVYSRWYYQAVPGWLMFPATWPITRARCSFLSRLLL